MAANPQATFDIGPLSWVKTEIEHSLTEANVHLDTLAQNPADSKAVKYVATHLHQVTGALSMVSLGAASRFNEELEKLVATLEDPTVRGDAVNRIAIAKRASASLSGYLDNLMAGEPDRPMLLAQSYLLLNRARGANDAAESDLFSPDLSIAVPMPEDTVALPKADMVADAIRQRRGLYQAGLLKLLRDKDLVAGARDMRNAALAIEMLQVTSPTRSFWYTVSGFFDAVIVQPAETGSMAVQLFGKIDQQIKLLIDGVQKVPERLFRDLLLVIGKSTAHTERIARVRQLYRLDELLAVPDAARDSGADDHLKAELRVLRDHVQALKEHWLKFTSGNRPALEPFILQGEALSKAAQLLTNRDMQQLLQMLSAVGPHLRKTGLPLSETQGLEVATALLFAESSLENFFRLSGDFPAQVAGVIARVKGAMTGAALPDISAEANTLMDDISKRAQEHLLIFQVGQEVQVNLTTIESALDNYFRDPLKTGELTSLLPLFSQVQGAFAILELGEAAALNQILRDRVAQFASGAVKGEGDNAESVAEGISALGLYITALQQSTANPRDALLPALVRFGLAEKPAEPEHSAIKSPVSAGDVDVAKQKVQALYADWKQQPEATTSRDQLREAVKELKQEAELIADTRSAKQSEEVLRAIDGSFDPLKGDVSEALQEIAPANPAATPALQTVHLIDAPAAQVDQELLEIFLEEAIEVVATIREHLVKAKAVPHDREALTTIRRGYHTLKGSGRMVGLNDLGEVAWDCEQVLNKRLKDESPATPGLLYFIERSSSAFAGWVDTLKASGTANIDGAEIARLADLLKNDREPEIPAAATVETSAQVHGVSSQLPTSPTTTGTAVTPAHASGGKVTELSDRGNVVIGTISVPAQLFSIYLGEAEIHIATLDNEMATIESNLLRPVSYDFMRAAHTLTSSSRTTGFMMIADVAFALEKWLQDAIETPPEWTDLRLGLTRQAVDALGSMVRGLHTHDLPMARPDLTRDLTALRDALKEGKRTGEGTNLRMPVVSEPALPGPTEPLTPAPTVEAAAADTAEADIDFGFIDNPPPETMAPPAEADAVIDFGFIDAPVEAPAPAEEAAPVSAPSVVIEPVIAQAPAPIVAPPPAVMPTTMAPLAVAGSEAVAAPVAAFESGKDRRAVVDDIDADLLPIFLEEARELVPQVGDALRRWRATPADHAPVTELARHLHTLKGSARMAGLMRLGELAHVLEAKAIGMDADAMPVARKFDDIDDGLDRFNAAIERFAAGELNAPIDIPPIVDVPQELPAPMAILAAARAEIVAEGEKLDGRERQALLRVNADIIDRFVNEAGELAIARSRIDLEMQAFKRSLLELNDNVSRMKSQLREIEIQAETQIQSRIKEQQDQGENFDPLEFDRFSRMQELTRFLAESLNDVVTLQQSLQKNLDESDAALLQQSRLNRDLQQGLMGVRLVPLGNLQDRFYRLVRQTAKELDKKANLEFRGVRVEIDRSVLEKITAPFEHLLRNAVAHGLEMPAERSARGKSEIGEITIDAQQVGNEVVLTLSDDGGGLNFARIREKAIEQGMLAPDAEASEAQLTQFIFAAGFSTAKEVTQIAGRGVGMDVVRNEIVSLGGRIDITSSAGRGTTFTIALPLTLAVTQALMVVIGETTYAIPSVMIEQVQEYKGKRYEPLLAMSEIEWKGNKYPLRSMAALVGDRPVASAQRKASVILAKSGQQRAAVQVDEIIGNREIVVKNIGPQLARLIGVAGATVMGSGQVILIMNPVQLVYREAATVMTEHIIPVARIGAQDAGFAASMAEAGTDSLLSAPKSQSLSEAIAEGAGDDTTGPAAVIKRIAPLVMVVDDSLTVRKITSRMLTREGFEVATAKDGVDGLQQLQDIEPDIILLDIEMPRMDGFEFARNMRADPKVRHIPIIMITSRTADKHRNRAMELGVNEYMGKPYQEEQLLMLIRQYTGQQVAA